MAYTTIDDTGLYFNTVLYTGTGSELAISGVGFQPDFTWLKARGNTNNHNLFDAVRGVTKLLISHTSAVEATEAQSLKTFDSDGFTLGTDGHINASSITYASWNWKESAVSGFDIVGYTGNATDDRTVSHSLSQTPDMVIIKARENTSSWVVWHKGLTGSDYCMFLDATDAQAQYSTILKNQSSSVLTLGTNSAANANTEGHIAYLFASKQGFSKFGKYTGNGNTDGPFIYTGFKPAWVMVKRTDTGASWNMMDNKRDPFNVMNTILLCETNNTEADMTSTNRTIDFISNGFKIRYTTAGGTTEWNTSGGSYVYMTFAEAPFVNSNGVPCNAR